MIYSTLCGFMLVGLYAGYWTKSKREFLLRWKGWSEEWDQWVDEENIGQCDELIQEYKAALAAKKARMKDTEPRLKGARGTKKKRER